MKNTFRIISRLLLLIVMGISLSLLNKSEAQAAPTITTESLPVGTVGTAYSQTLSAADTSGAVTWNISEGGLPAGLSLASSTGVISGTPTVAETANFTVTVTDSNGSDDRAFIIDINTETVATPPNDNSGDPPKGGTDDPPEPKEPDPTTTQTYFLNETKSKITNLLNTLAGLTNQDEINALKSQGLVIDAGNWESFDSTTCIKIDELLTKGVPVTIKYRHEGKNKEVTIPVDFGQKYKIFDMCDYDPNAGEGSAGYVGFEYIFASVVAGKPIDKNPPKTNRGEQTHNTVMGAEVGMAALSAGNDFIGAATEGLSLATNIGADGVSSFASMGGGSIRQETG